MTAAARAAAMRKQITERLKTERARRQPITSGRAPAKIAPRPVAVVQPTALVIGSPAVPATRETAEAGILAVLPVDGGELTLDDLAMRIGKDRSTIFRALRRLMAAGRVSRHGTGTRFDPHRFVSLHCAQ
jgi:hypothetical protein